MNPHPFEIGRTTLPSGMKVVTARKTGTPMFFAVLVLNGGSIYDPPGKYGVAELVSRFLEKDTIHFSREEIASFIEGLGGSIESDSGHYTQQIRLNILSQFAEHGLKMMAEMAANPVFDAEELEIEKEKLISEHNEALTIPFEALQYAFSMMLYRGHPLGIPSNGVVETIPGITTDDLNQFHANFFRPSNAILIVVSDMEHDRVVEMAGTAFAEWKSFGDAVSPELPDVKPIKGVHVAIVDMPTTQAYISLGHHAPLRSDPDFPALHVLNFAIGGGGMLSRMMRIIRVEKGLAYGAQSVIRGGLRFPGVFMARTESKISTGSEAIQLIMDILRDIHENGITENELKAAQSFYQGSIPRMTETNRQVASALINCELFGLPDFYWLSEVQRIKELQLEEVNEVARSFLHPEDFVLVISVDKSKFDLKLHGFAPENITIIKPDELKSTKLLED